MMQVRITMECHSPEDEYLYLPFSIGEKLADMILKPPSYIIKSMSVWNPVLSLLFVELVITLLLCCIYSKLPIQLV